MEKKFTKKLKISLLSGLFLCASCTYNISMAHTEGSASDVIDDTQTPTSTVSPDVKIPLIGG